MPAGLFFGTTITTYIFVLKKNKKDNSVLFIDASEECIPNSNRGKNDKKIKMLSQDNIDNILKLIKDRQSIEHKTHLATFAEVEKAEFNLSANTYVAKKDTSEIVDIAVLNADIKQIVARQNELRTSLDAIIDDIEGGQG